MKRGTNLQSHRVLAAIIVPLVGLFAAAQFLVGCRGFDWNEESAEEKSLRAKREADAQAADLDPGRGELERSREESFRSHHRR